MYQVVARRRIRPSASDTISGRNADLRRHLERRCRFASRTPAPPPFSGINSTPACWSAATRDSPVSARPPMSPSAASSRLTVGADTPDRVANSSWDQPSSALAALICRIDTFSIDTPTPLRYFWYQYLKEPRWPALYLLRPPMAVLAANSRTRR
jgi:hypothetical protein